MKQAHDEIQDTVEETTLQRRGALSVLGGEGKGKGMSHLGTCRWEVQGPLSS